MRPRRQVFLAARYVGALTDGPPAYCAVRVAPLITLKVED